MSQLMLDLIGWIATAAFAFSYLVRNPLTLRRVQALAAVIWIGYGLAIGSMPVVVANAIVASLAAWSSLRRREPVSERPSGPSQL